MLKKYYEISSEPRIPADKCSLYRGNNRFFRNLVGNLKVRENSLI
jgi:hypothetical protein